MFVAELNRIGIAASTVYQDWDGLFGKVLCTKCPTDKTYENGGYDAMAVGWGPSHPEFEPSGNYASWNEPFFNYELWENSTNDNLIKQYDSQTNEADRLNTLTQWQLVFHQNEPTIIIPSGIWAFAHNPHIHNVMGTSWFQYDVANPGSWTVDNAPPGGATVKWASSGLAYNFNPILIDADYENFHTAPVFNTLASYDSPESLKIIPQLATDWTHSADGLHWVINLRQDVKWQDGWPFNATDVKFTWDSMLNPDIGAPLNAEWKLIFGSPDAIKITGPYQVTVDLPKPYGLFESHVLFSWVSTENNEIIPWHVLKDVKPADWHTHPFNTGVGTYTVKTPDGKDYVAHGPIGTGPFIFMGRDVTQRTTHEVRNPNYWDKTPGPIGTGGGNVQDFWFVYISDVDAAITALKNGQVDFLEGTYYYGSKASVFDPSWSTLTWGNVPIWFEIGLNMKTPIWGTGAETPLGKQDPSKAWEAARDIRYAMAYATPYDAITKLNGQAFNTPTPLNPAFKGYINNTSIPAFTYNITKAMQYMEMAGYSYGAPVTSATSATSAEAAGTSMWQLLAGVVGVLVVIGVVAFALLRRRKGANPSPP